MPFPRLPLDYFTPPLASYFEEMKKDLASRKRKRGLDSNEDENESVHGQEELSGNGLPQSSSLTSSIPIHGGPSPRRPQPNTASQDATEDIDNFENRDEENEINQRLPRRLEMIKFKSENLFGSRKQHFAVLTTILHRCLLQHDYKRAGRAWGMLLRSQYSGESLSLRNRNNWGIGAEMLLHREAKTSNPDTRGDQAELDLLVDMNTATEEASFPFPLENFDLVKEYYDRLILQYPFMKRFPNHLCEIQFYPTLFTLWIASIQERMLRAEQVALCTDIRPPPRGPAAALIYNIKGTLERPLVTEQMFPIPRIQALRQAQELAKEMEDLTVSPLYSDSLPMLRLKAMLHAWTADMIYQTWVLLTLYPDPFSPNDKDDVAQCATFWADLTAHSDPSQLRKGEIDEAKRLFTKMKEEHDTVEPGFMKYLHNPPKMRQRATTET